MDIIKSTSELGFLRHPGIQAGRKNVGNIGRSGYNVTKLSNKRIESIKEDKCHLNQVSQ